MKSTNERTAFTLVTGQIPIFLATAQGSVSLQSLSFSTRALHHRCIPMCLGICRRRSSSSRQPFRKFSLGICLCCTPCFVFTTKGINFTDIIVGFPVPEALRYPRHCALLYRRGIRMQLIRALFSREKG